MSSFWKIKNSNYSDTATQLKKCIPHLKKMDHDALVDHLRGSNLSFIKQECVKTPLYMRFTLPFGLLAMVVLILISPLKFIITGKWHYRWLWLTNWFRALSFVD